MKLLISFILICALVALTFGVFVPPRHSKKQHLLGESQCTYGPSYWCTNLTTAADCHATKHCIEKKWIYLELPPDTSSICDTCREMVKEARDQLESNETQELIKEVFEGTCALIHLKPIVKECDKLADDYIPELIETLASQMNPQIVCSVAGLCNNPRIHQLLAAESKQIEQSKQDNCESCNTVMNIVEKKFNVLSQEEFLNVLLQMCGQVSSYSDACSSLVIKNFYDIYSYLKNNLNAGDFCLVTGQCIVSKTNKEIEITPLSKYGYVDVKQQDDMPCELCEQLVNHLRDILVANTTESKFKEVLEGICKQTGAFKQQCLDCVENYYPLIYALLVNELNATKTCELMGLCPQKGRQSIAPILLGDAGELAHKLKQEIRSNNGQTGEIVIKPKDQLENLPAEQLQLPIDRILPYQNIYNEQLCLFCQYFLHYCQQAISKPAVEDEIKKIIDQACSKLPSSINGTCLEFVDTYEQALVALLAQEIDPSQICPMIRVCPSMKEQNNVDIFMKTSSSDKCPFCLAIVTKIESLIKDKSNKEEIKKVLESACDYLPNSLKGECTSFIDKYSDLLVEMIVADFKPSEVCVYLKFCEDLTPVSSEVSLHLPKLETFNIETNVIYDNTVDGKHVATEIGDEKCILCEFIMKEIDDRLKDQKTEEDLKKLVHGICSIMPRTIKSECNNFIDEYADAIFVLLQEALKPAEICAMIKLCPKQNGLDTVKDEVMTCGVCRSAVDTIKTILENPNVDQNMEHVYEKTCRTMADYGKKTCQHILANNGLAITALLTPGRDSKHVCEAINLCNSSGSFPKVS